MSDLKNPQSTTTGFSLVTGHLVFRVDSIEKTTAPGPGQGSDWYRYVLKNDSSTITGVRRGTKQNVRDYATEYVEQLNLRIKLGPSLWNPRNRKPGRPPSS